MTESFVPSAQPLDEDAERLLRAWASVTAAPIEQQPLAAARSSQLVNAAVTGPPPPVPDVREAVAPGSPDVPVRLYRLGGPLVRPVIVYAHGGGWMLLSPDSVDVACRHLAVMSGCDVVSVDYRLAPEHPFPAAFDDVRCAVSWVTQGGLGARPPRIAVAGDSAGGNLAAAVALWSVGRNDVRVDLQVLLYPAIEPVFDTDSMVRFGADPLSRLSPATMRYFWTSYVGDEAHFNDARAVPTVAPSLHRAPAAIVVTAGHDALRDEGGRYACLLSAQGVATTHLEFPTLPHGFVMMFGAVPSALDAWRDVASAVRAALEPLPALAREFKERPFGRHSAELQQLLNQMRAAPLAGKHFLFIDETNRRWALGWYDDSNPPQPTIDWDCTFDDLESAEWHVFRLRWRARFGQELPA